VKRIRDLRPTSDGATSGIVSFLSAEDLAELKPLLQTVSPRIMDLVANWYQLYKMQYQDHRSLTETEFQQLFGISLLKSTRSLLDNRVEDYAAEVRRLGVVLAQREVPFEEVALVHLYWTMGLRIFADSGVFNPNIYRAFEKLNYVRMTLIGDAYFRFWAGEQGVRLSEVEREAAKIPPEERTQFHGLIGASLPMRALYRRIESAGQTRGTVLIVGESGTGKELVARAIHECGAAEGAPFVALNCAALPTHLIESELFGYRRGAFSGANADYLGLFRAADGGTLFLDEITEMSAETQSKLLRAVQERKVRPVGATAEMAVNVRLVASTNRDPNAAVADGHLRQDLYYRLQASVLMVPPLRERIDDVPTLAEHFIRIFNERMGQRHPVAGIDDDALEAMKRHRWPGNVRELSNLIEGAFTFGASSNIKLDDLSGLSAAASIKSPARETSTSQLASDPQAPQPASQSSMASRAKFDEMECDLIRRTLEKTAGNKSRAAQLLGISRKRLYARIERYGLE
ncbi:MAG TPA: sigma-54 dependent transcriptional regulator, partial [Candidatus Binataceae bacterium]|nr:sigma-54 dependent transcriptional regulator [Candidatus Binataceae bacterium]